MNPSANGWIKKCLKEVSKNDSFLSHDIYPFYESLKQCGFIYGSNVEVVMDGVVNRDFSHKELGKVNLLLAFYYVHHLQKEPESFIDSLVSFYNTIAAYKRSFFEDLLGEKSAPELLENIIDKRVHIDDNIITKNFNYFITNALLFVDVLAYQKYLSTQNITEAYIKQLEACVETIVVTVFDYKAEKSQYDKSLIKLLKASLRYQNKESLSYDDVINCMQAPLAKFYITDVVCMAFWSDKIIDSEEQQFLKRFGNDLQLPKEVVQQSVEDIDLFYKANKDKIALLNSKNMVQSFYDNSSRMVSKLIKRNSKRLLKELRQSKELMVLLTKSTTRPLTDEEQKKVTDQLLDIIKSIPSLAIFLLPGGMLLLPIFIKFIPKLLPSAFDDNRLEDE
ncbi:LETM1-related biofilm-associated protein [Mangrovimonas sp. YM274]|uniref:LETM1-related biofilm-associated protein n=1 Tax=Mangrovimonas sp. YM274 TaxID=3070660 RepID=UPI0027DE39D8|nr:LETM1-related biofilm-associated protein [Mangrovimonas sp. YM274]WMI69887.1 LETM1-related biofilm-associated protein [Mangrovimonas sp. YM274]